MRNDYRDYLMHYGVKGMKWRNHKKAAISYGMNKAATIVKYPEVSPTRKNADVRVKYDTYSSSRDGKVRSHEINTEYRKKVETSLREKTRKTKKNQRSSKRQTAKRRVLNAIRRSRPVKNGLNVSVKTSKGNYKVREVRPSMYDRVSQVNRSAQRLISKRTGKVIQPRKRR